MMEDLTANKEMEELASEILEEEEFISIEDEEELLEKLEQENQLESNQVKEIEEASLVTRERENYEKSSVQPDLNQQEFSSQELETKNEVTIQRELIQETHQPVIQSSEFEPQKEITGQDTQFQKLEQTKDGTSVQPMKKIEFTKIQKTPLEKTPIIIPPSRRPDGSIRKAKKVRPDYVSPDEQILTQVSNKEIKGKSEIITSTPTIKQNDEKNIEEKTVTSIEPSNSTLQKMHLQSTLREQGLFENKEIDELESIIKTSTRSILNSIEKFRKTEGTFLIQKIAQQYGLKVSIEDADNVDSETNDHQNSKRRKLTTI